MSKNCTAKTKKTAVAKIPVLAGASRAVGYPPTVSYGQKPEPTLKEDIK